MAEEQVCIAVGYSGKEKLLPLAVTPALELSDEQVDWAEGVLMRILRHNFRILPGASAYLHEAETGRIMTKESFRDPANLPQFPRHWYLTVETLPVDMAESPVDNGVYLEDKLPSTNGPVDYPEDLLLADSQLTPPGEGEDALPSLAEMSFSEAKYQTMTIRCDGEGSFGFALRHFTIQPSNIPRADTPSDPPSRSASRNSMQSADSLDMLRLSTTFVYSVYPSGCAEGAGLEVGEVVHMINGVSVIRSSVEEVEEILGQCGEELVIMLLPQGHDDLQFFYPQYTYGEVGEYTTSEGKVSTFDLPVVMTTSKLIGRPRVDPQPTGNHIPQDSVDSSEDLKGGPGPDVSEGRLSSSSPPLGLVPFNEADESAPSLDNSNPLLCSNENMIVRQSSNDDVLISGSLSEIPITLATSPTVPKFSESEMGWDVQQPEPSGPILPLHQMADYNQDLSPTWQSLFPSALQNGDVSAPHLHPGGLEFISEDPPQVEWYKESVDTFAEYSYQSLAQDSSRPEDPLQSSVSDTNFLEESRPRKRAGRTRSHGSIERHSTLPHIPLLPSHPHRSVRTSSTSALDRIQVSRSQASVELSKSTHLGVVKMNRRGVKKSLEVLTRIGSEEDVKRYGKPSGPQLKRHRSDGNAHRVRLSGSDQEQWGERSGDSSHHSKGNADLDTSQRSASQQASTQLSEQSVPEEHKHSGESGSVPHSGESGSVPHSGDSGSVRNEGSSTFKGKRLVKSYQSQRAQLHKSRPPSVKSTTTETDPASGERRLRRRISREDRSPSIEPFSGRASRRARRLLSSQEQKEASSESEVSWEAQPPEPDKPEKLTPEIAKLDKHASPEGKQAPSPSPVAQALPERDTVSIYNTLLPKREKTHRERPLSATETSRGFLRSATGTLDFRTNTHDPRSFTSSLEPTSPGHKFTHSVEVPLRTDTGRKIPIYHTRSAQTPFGEQIIREVPIDEAIRFARVGSPRSYSVDSGVVVSASVPGEGEGEQSQRKKAKNWNIFGGKQKYQELAASDERLFPPKRSPSPDRRHSGDLTSSISPTHLNKFHIQCHGYLHKKQDRDDTGKRSHDRSWKTYFAVLSGNKIVFFKDKRDAYAHKPCEEPAIEVVPSVTEVATNYTKKKFVFRVTTTQGSEFLLQAEDGDSMQRWVLEVQRLNGSRRSSVDRLASRPRDSEVKLSAPSSPLPPRRVASPQPPGKTSKRKEEGGSRLIDRLKKTLTRSKDEPDSSSFITFGQPLEECPVSPDNKRVPLVVEHCVKEVEEHGITTEGIYRKGGQLALIKTMSADMDRGTYSFSDYGDIHNISSLLKKFLKELPDPLIPSAMYADFIACGRQSDEEQRTLRLQELVYRLPIAHYHTLKYLMTHLNKVTKHSKENKMTMRNVSLVFGPTLVRHPDNAEGDELSDMSAGYVIVEMLCKHVEYFFRADLCAEEVELQEQELMASAREEEAVRGSPLLPRDRTMSEPTILDARQKKDIALAKASPMAVRRIKNNFSASVSNGSKPVEGKRNSLIDWSSSLQRKQHNSDTTRSSYHSYPRPTPEILPSYTGSPHTQLRKQIHRPSEAGHSNDATARTRLWVNHHNQMGWGAEEETPREMPGSMWASRNKEAMQQRVQQKDRKEKPRRLSKTRQQLLTSSLPPSEPVRELLGSYHSPTAHSSIPELPEGMGRSLQTSPKRRVSYAAAMEEQLYKAHPRYPVRDRHVESQHDRHIERHSDRRSTPEWYSQSRNFEDSREFETGGYHQQPASTTPGGYHQQPASTTPGGYHQQPASTTPGGYHQQPASTTPGGYHQQPASTTPYRHRPSWRGSAEYAADRKEEDAMMRELSGLPVYSYLRKSSGTHVSPYGNPRRPERLPNPSAYPPQIESYL